MFEGKDSLVSQNRIYDKQDTFQIIRIGQVVDTLDVNNLGRIKVRIKGNQSNGGDDGISKEDLCYSYPLLPKHLQVIPKIGESVFIFVFDKNKQHTDRLYIGPITSQPDKLNYDDGKLSGLTGFSFGPMMPDVNVDNIPQLKGVFPKKEDVSIQGRQNTEITQRVNEVLIRCGKFESSQINDNNPYPIKFNANTQSYIQLKNDVTIPNGDNPYYGTVTNIVANKINLITHRDSNIRFDVLNQDNLISESEMQRILTEGFSIPYGEMLLEYLKLLKNAFLSHVHNGNGNPPTDLITAGPLCVDTFRKRAEDIEKKMLSKNVKLN